MISPASVLREGCYLALPALAVVLLLATLGYFPPGAALIAALVAIAAGLGLAVRRMIRLRRLAHWLELVASGQSADAPEVGQLLAGLVRPLLDVEHAMRELRQEVLGQRQLLDGLLEALPDPVLLVDRHRRVLRANQSARHSFGDNLVGLDLGRGIRDPAVLSALGAALDADVGSSVEFSPAGQRNKRWAARIEPMVLPDGVAGVLMAFREQSEQVMIERMRSDFVANASHEIRTPLAAIQGLIETLQGPARDDPSARQSFLEIMAQETSRITRLVEDLLSLSRIELAANQPPTAPCDVRAVLATVIDRLRPIASKRRVTIELDIPSCLPPVLGDHDQLYQLLVNLVDNAIKYGGDGKTVHVEATTRDAAPVDAGPASGRPCLEIGVVDEGDGIAREHIPRLTERFYRIDKGRSRGQGGTGLGLAIVKHIVRRHGGHLAIDSTPGKGSRFRVFLPLPEAATGASHGTVTVAS